MWLGLSEIIEHNVNGYLVPPNDLNAFAEAILSIYLNSEIEKVFSEIAE